MRPLVLVVEDFDDARAIVREVLEHHGYGVIAVSDGQQAIAEAQARLPDLVLLDLSIPRLSGWDVARRLRDDVELQRTPIIALTAHSHSFSIGRARASGCDHVLVKPVPHDELLTAIGLFVAARPDPSGVVPRVGAVSVEETRGAPTGRRRHAR